MPNSQNIIVVGAGVGGLSAALRLAQRGHDVTILEARSAAGGLASGLTFEGFDFDAGPYILLDQPGLAWAFGQLGLDIGALDLQRIEHIYQVLHANGQTSAFGRSLSDTAAAFEQQYPGSGRRYEDFVQRMTTVHARLQPLTYYSRPGPLLALRHGAWRELPFLLRSLDGILRGAKLPEQMRAAIGIWTHIAGQPMTEAPSPMAFVPGLMHGAGAYYPAGGMRAVPAALAAAVAAAGIAVRYDTRVASIRTRVGAVTGVATASGEFLPAAAVVSDVHGIGTCAELVADYPPAPKARLQRLPLQSPGTCVYLAVRGRAGAHYLNFRLRENNCVTFVQPGLLGPPAADGWYPARLIAPLAHAQAAALGEAGQNQLMESQLNETWWREGLTDFRVLHRRTTFEWGQHYHLYRDSMNPVMTARLMLAGRLPHRNPDVRGLYLTGSATHPGQWVSFCTIAGILAADCLADDLPARA